MNIKDFYAQTPGNLHGNISVNREKGKVTVTTAKSVEVYRFTGTTDINPKTGNESPVISKE